LLFAALKVQELVHNGISVKQLQTAQVKVQAPNVAHSHLMPIIRMSKDQPFAEAVN
jgi:hypothetical protein